MDKLRKREQFTDVTLVSGDYRALCHRNVLAAASPYFNTMFTSNLSESQSDTVTLQIDPVTLGLVVDYMYSGEMKITVDNVQILVETSDLLMLDDLKAACDQFMSERVDKTDRVEMFKFSLIYRLKKLRQATKLTTDFVFFVSTAEFLELTNKELVDYISGDDVNVDSEDTVLEAVLNWVKHDPDKRKPSLSAILEEARLQFCTGHYLRKVVDSCEVLTSEAQIYIRMALKFHAGTDPILSETCHSSPEARTSYRMKRHLLVIDSNDKCVRYWENGSGSWKVLTYLPQSVGGNSVACVLNDGLVLTGTDGNCWKFHFQNRVWVKLPSLNKVVYSQRSVVVGSAVYVVGTTDMYSSSNATNVERLDHNDREWSSLPNVPELVTMAGHTQPVTNPLVVACDRGFYVFNNNNNSLCTQFYTIGGECLTRAAMPEGCYRAAAVMLNGHIYVVGGINRSCQRYNPATNTWQQLSRPDQGRSNAAAGVWHGRILLAKTPQGGFGTTPSNSIMQYDPAIDQWSDWQSEGPCELSHHSMFAVNL